MVSDPALFGYATKDDVLADAARYWNPAKTRFWREAGVPLVIGRREGYVLTDIDGHQLIDVHLNGGTYNLGHRHPELVTALVDAVQHVDAGNHHFPAPARTALARELIAGAPAGLRAAVFGAAGGEAIDLAIKSARYATGRRTVVSIRKAFHGHTGLAVATGDERFARLFLSDRPDEFVQVRFNDIDQMQVALCGRAVAAVVMETIPATYGFPMPAPGYLAAVKDLCEETGTLYIADEVQTGLQRTGSLWAISKHGVDPDILVTGKGLGGGLYPISAALLSERPAAWLEHDGFAHMSTYGGSELGSAVALKVLEITTRDSTVRHVRSLSEQLRIGLAAIRDRHPDVLTGIRQDGLVIGLEFAAEEGAKPVMAALYETGVWAIFSTLDPQVLQFKPGLLLSALDADVVLDRLEHVVATVGARV